MAFQPLLGYLKLKSVLQLQSTFTYSIKMYLHHHFKQVNISLSQRDPPS